MMTKWPTSRAGFIESCLFFFSSRRRHTIFDCDWSSDVCSSDLVGQLRRLVAQSMLAREQTGGPEDAREGLVVEDSRQRLCEHRGNAELAVADRPCERLTCGGRPVLDVRDQLQPALRRPAELGMC